MPCEKSPVSRYSLRASTEPNHEHSPAQPNFPSGPTSPSTRTTRTVSHAEPGDSGREGGRTVCRRRGPSLDGATSVVGRHGFLFLGCRTGYGVVVAFGDGAFLDSLCSVFSCKRRGCDGSGLVDDVGPRDCALPAGGDGGCSLRKPRCMSSIGGRHTAPC